MPDELVESLREAVGDGLRVVATYTRDGYDGIYARDDVEARVAEKADQFHDELIIQGLGKRGLEDLFEAGELHCSMHRFDELTAFHFAADDHSGLFVSVDSDVDVPLREFSRRCKRALE